ncbi:MAG TPA: GDSL-type esterase/lipase family protein [Flavitalea sp.]|nr:GDSL-type esterase/lipase family protein [Flavitalea sp.]
MIKSLRFLAVFFLFHAMVLSSCSQAQQKRYEKTIAAFKKADIESPPPVNAILLVGSSSFTIWKDVADYFPEYTIINRGYGGSKLTDLIDYVDDVIIPYKPKQVVIYCGENDVAGDPVTADDVLQRFTTLFQMIRKGLPDASIAYVSMKPSPSREKFLPVITEGNAKIRDFLATQPKTSYIDIYQAMLDAEGKMRPELFQDDMLHMNPKGYAIWKEVMQPYLLK